MVQGRPLLRNGQFVHHDLEHILQRCEEITARIERTLAEHIPRQAKTHLPGNQFSGL